MERIGVCCAETWNRTTRLGPSSGKSRVRMGYSADRWKVFVEFEVSSKVGRRAQISIDDPTLKISNYNVLQSELVIGNSAWLGMAEDLNLRPPGPEPGALPG